MFGMMKWNWKNWNVKNWFNGGLVKVIAEADKIIDEQGQEIKAYKELIQKHESLEQYWKKYAESLEHELKTKERTIETYSELYNKVADEVDSLKEQIKEYNELVEKDWAE